jgi:putative hemolysin
MESDPLLWQLLLQLLLIICNAIFACAEIAFISITSVKLEKLSAGGNRKAGQLLKLTSKPAKFLATIQVAITMAGFLGSAFAADNFSGRLTAAMINAGAPVSPELTGTISLILITMILSFFTLVLGELVPKRIAMHNAEKLALALSSFIFVISRIFAPVVWLLEKSTNLLIRLFGIDPEAEGKAVTEEEIRLLVDAGSERGAIAASEKEIIHNVFEFNDKTAEAVMTHRRDTTLLWLKDDDEAWEKIILEVRHGYYPVCGDTVDDIRGVLSARDYLALKDRSRELVMEKALRPAWFVPSSVGTHVLFRKMKARRSHFALALDEYGSFDGIITMTDLLETLVGDLGEEDDEADFPQIEKKGPDLWQISGGVSLDLAAKELGVSFTDVGNFDTFGGFVFTHLGRLPNDGEQCELEYPLEDKKLHITVTEVKNHRLESALVRLLS